MSGLCRIMRQKQVVSLTTLSFHALVEYDGVFIWFTGINGQGSRAVRRRDEWSEHAESLSLKRTLGGEAIPNINTDCNPFICRNASNQ